MYSRRMFCLHKTIMKLVPLNGHLFAPSPLISLIINDFAFLLSVSTPWQFIWNMQPNIFSLIQSLSSTCTPQYMCSPGLLAFIWVMECDISRIWFLLETFDLQYVLASFLLEDSYVSYTVCAQTQKLHSVIFFWQTVTFNNNDLIDNYAIIYSSYTLLFLLLLLCFRSGCLQTVVTQRPSLPHVLSAYGSIPSLCDSF